MDTRLHMPVSWSAVRADPAGATAEGEVGAESVSEHPAERDAMMVKADKERKTFMTRLQSSTTRMPARSGSSRR
jgi:hypothetical protein